MPYANAEDRKAAEKRHYEKHKEKIIARQMKRYHEKKEEILEKQKIYVENNKEKIALYRDQWRQDNLDKVHEQQQKRRAIKQRTDPEYRKKNAEHARNWREKIKLEMISAYGGKCVICGESRPECLTIDHVDGGGCEHRRSIGGYGSGGSSFYNWLKIQGWPQNEYRLLCWNDNCKSTEKKKASCTPHTKPSTHASPTRCNPPIKGEI